MGRPDVRRDLMDRRVTVWTAAPHALHIEPGRAVPSDNCRVKYAIAEMRDLKVGANEREMGIWQVEDGDVFTMLSKAIRLSFVCLEMKSMIADQTIRR